MVRYVFNHPLVRSAFLVGNQHRLLFALIFFLLVVFSLSPLAFAHGAGACCAAPAGTDCDHVKIETSRFTVNGASGCVNPGADEPIYWIPYSATPRTITLSVPSADSDTRHSDVMGMAWHSIVLPGANTASWTPPGVGVIASPDAYTRTWTTNDQVTPNCYGFSCEIDDYNNFVNEDPVTITCWIAVVKVDSLEWETYGDNTPLDNITDSDGRALKRIYPDLKSITEAGNVYTGQTTAAALGRYRVNVKATLYPPLQNIPVIFRAFDIDEHDDMQNAAPLDKNGYMQGWDPASWFGAYDNRSGAPNAISSVTSVTDGVARGVFDVGMQPGDNYRVAASVDAYAIQCSSSIGCNHGSRICPLQLKAELGGDNYPYAKFTSIELSVWRKLWLEMDSMGAPGALQTGSHIFDGDGALSGMISALSTWQLSDTNSNKEWRPENQLNGGRVFVEPGDPDEVEASIGGNYQNYLTTITSNLLSGYAVPPCPYEIKLDDPFPNFNAMGMGFIENAFAACYITINNTTRLSQWESTQVGFSRVLDNSLETLALGQANKGCHYDSSSFWVAYSMLVYEIYTSADCDYCDGIDDQDELLTRGINLASEPEYSFVGREAIRDGAIFQQKPYRTQEYTAAHEIGHQFELDDINPPNTDPSDDSIMEGQNVTGFNPSEQDAVRSIVNP